MKVKKKSNALRNTELKKAVKNKTKSSTNAGESTVRKAVKEILQKKQTAIEAAKKNAKEPLFIKPRKRHWEFKSTRGVVYIGHIPHGFYEEQMKDYFSQFGRVTRVRLARSKKTGASRGYGYVEFQHQEVAKIAAETMNNYLMCGRLLKATYIPPEKQHAGFFLGPSWSRKRYPTLTNRRRITTIRNSTISDKKHRQYVNKTLKNLTKLEEKLKEKGIDLKFKPVDLPDEKTKEKE